jgi:hypothetical protein
MNRKSINGRALSMHRKFEYVPTAFRRTNIACIQILLDLVTILVISKSESGAVMTFEDVFGNVFARICRDAYFDVDMTIVSKQGKIS